jgi:hypothetical protein
MDEGEPGTELAGKRLHTLEAIVWSLLTGKRDLWILQQIATALLPYAQAVGRCGKDGLAGLSNGRSWTSFAAGAESRSIWLKE